MIKEGEDKMKQEKSKEPPWLDGDTKNVKVMQGFSSQFSADFELL